VDVRGVDVIGLVGGLEGGGEVTVSVLGDSVVVSDILGLDVVLDLSTNGETLETDDGRDGNGGLALGSNDVGGDGSEVLAVLDVDLTGGRLVSAVGCLCVWYGMV